MRPTLRHLLFGQAPFSPRNLFLSGEVGAWYEPGSLDTLYQTSTGTTPVTAGEQPVGLVLDKSKGMALGPELVTNGDFSGGSTGWSAVGCTLNTASGAAVMTNTGTNGRIYQSFTAVIGKTYKITASVISGTSTIYLSTSTSASGGVANTGSIAAGTYTFYGVATATTMYILAYDIGAISAEASVDNISVRELPGSHALQSSSTLRPTYKTGPNRLYFDADPDSLAITFPSAPGDCTLAYGTAGGEPVITYPVNISGTTYTIDPSVIGTFGPELVTNGSLADSTGWTLGAGWSIGSGVLSFSNPIGTEAYYAVASTTGKVFKVEFDVVITSRSGSVYINSPGISNTVTFSSSGRKTAFLTATNNHSRLSFLGVGASVFTIDNVSAKELTGAAAQNTGLVIVNRALTAAETVKLTQYLKTRS